jgi:diguanylate cyclase (GGDEF)-like protein
MFVGGIFDILDGSLTDELVPPLSSWFSLIQFESLVYSIGTAVFMVLLCKQRSENRHIFAARHDTMTGIVNRGAFIEAATRILDRQRADAAAVSLIMFDLDRFKTINDTYGHSVGDEVIRLFTVTAQRVLRPNDILGRYGGEEFAVMLPGATVEVAHAIGERIRYNFARAAVTVDGRPIAATISGGIATAVGDDMSLESLLRRADGNLYRAKRHGRNRIERDHGESAERVVRIA